MCGIFGAARLRGGAPATSAGERATDALLHRGPDERGTWEGDGVFLGMRRLSIIDLDGGQQPLWNAAGTQCIVYNGELYNYLDLRPELLARGHIFRSKSDTEVVLHAFEEWGEACLERFNGMFAFAIWDTRERTLFLARDRIGEKPLYYHVDGERLLFASEIKALLADADVPRRVSLPGLANYLTFGHAVAPVTMFDGIRKLLPGHTLTLRGGAISVRRYWDVCGGAAKDAPTAEPTEISASEDLFAQRVRDLLDDSVRRRMIADVPVGAFLSGGVDSSAIVALMRRHASGTVRTFSLGFRGSQLSGDTYNELSDARRVAQQLGTEHHELEVQHVDLVETLRTLVYHYDEPFGDEAGFPVYLLSRFAREYVKVVLGGDGGDELFGGYRRYVSDQLAPLYGALPGALTERWIPGLVDRLPRLRRVKRVTRALPIRDPARRYVKWQEVFSPDVLAELLRNSARAALDGHDPARAHVGSYRSYAACSSSGDDHLNALMYVDVKTLLPDAYMEKLDKATMARSLEGRLPFLDHRLVELAFRIPSRYKISGISTKRILKKAVAPLVPAEVLAKRKHGFAVPVDPWFRGSLRGYAREVLLDGAAKRRDYFDHGVVERLWREHADGRHVWDRHLWLLLNFELWHRIYLDGEGV